MLTGSVVMVYSCLPCNEKASVYEMTGPYKGLVSGHYAVVSRRPKHLASVVVVHLDAFFVPSGRIILMR